jgi:hypothetical protein
VIENIFLDAENVKPRRQPVARMERSVIREGSPGGPPVSASLQPGYGSDLDARNRNNKASVSRMERSEIRERPPGRPRISLRCIRATRSIQAICCATPNSNAKCDGISGGYIFGWCIIIITL